MRLTAQPITIFNNINSFTLGSEWIIRAGDPNTLYFQLFDLDANDQRHLTGLNGNTPVVVTVTFPSIDDNQVITKTATVDSNDTSVFNITLLNTDYPAGGNVFFSVTEGSVTRTFPVINMLSVEMVNQGSC
jgi:hypothetical protein